MCRYDRGSVRHHQHGGVLFGKNSDRERNEAQTVEFFAGAHHGDGERVEMHVYRHPTGSPDIRGAAVPAVLDLGRRNGRQRTWRVVGNEAVHARIAPQQEPALLGMDLLRLALERSATAAQAVDVITDLLEQFGQGGSCGHLTPRYYHNSFIIADPREAYVLETVGRMWAVERATASVRFPMPTASAEAQCERARVDRTCAEARLVPGRCGPRCGSLVQRHEAGRDQPWPRPLHAFNCIAASLCQPAACGDVMAILRDHGARRNPTPTGIRRTQRTARSACTRQTAIGEGRRSARWYPNCRADRIVHWVTATAAPCTSIFKPVLPGMALPAHGPRPTDRFDPSTLWWRHEQLHRAMLEEFPIHLAAIRAERDALEVAFRTRIDGVVTDGTDADRAGRVAECWATPTATGRRWLDEVGAVRRAGDAARLPDQLARTIGAPIGGTRGGG